MFIIVKLFFNFYNIKFKIYLKYKLLKLFFDYCNNFLIVMGIVGIIYIVVLFLLTVILLVSCTVLKNEKSINKLEGCRKPGNTNGKNEKKK